MIYKKEKKYFSEINKFIASFENAEKVVKEPNTPIIKKYFTNSSEKFLKILVEIMYPIWNEPITLTKKVP